MPLFGANTAHGWRFYRGRNLFRVRALLRVKISTTTFYTELSTATCLDVAWKQGAQQSRLEPSVKQPKWKRGTVGHLLDRYLAVLATDSGTGKHRPGSDSI